ncbi:MAG: hypothetical protein WCO69_02055 [Candidatus Omnitrophota bacterium]
MKITSMILMAAVFMMLSGVSSVSAQTNWGGMLKSVGQAVAVSLCPQAQQTVDQAKKLSTAPAQQQNFIIAKAKEYLAAKNYQPAYDLANYVLTLDPKSISAQKILTDAKVALAKMAQDHIAAAQQKITASIPPSDAQTAAARQQVEQAQKGSATTADSVNSLLGAFGTKK